MDYQIIILLLSNRSELAALRHILCFAQTKVGYWEGIEVNCLKKLLFFLHFPGLMKFDKKITFLDQHCTKSTILKFRIFSQCVNCQLYQTKSVFPNRARFPERNRAQYISTSIDCYNRQFGNQIRIQSSRLISIRLKLSLDQVLNLAALKHSLYF